VVEQTCHHRARWFGKNLAIALERMLASNNEMRDGEYKTIANTTKPL
jgi:hypothetical protein